MTEEVRTTSSTGARKGVKPQRPSLIPTYPFMELARHYGVGAEKYTERDEAGNVTHEGGNNWRAGYEWSKSYDAMIRHANAFWGGEDLDPETGTSHLSAVAWHAFTLLEFTQSHPEFDDRYKAPVPDPEPEPPSLRAVSELNHHRWLTPELMAA
ncbi:hypothetical protein GS982_01590 [Rhodococcus hoagii]|uniref:dATP/dGTP diphosphohydrolase N-terminal domain-containing protein n=1 Tax=Rhodococcus hoagii TaxID=43767 RepID=A0A9Q4ZIR5_RHOHA|nr:hypothetical protein [Prescottella equi]NKT77290.1 hypothetical protein [Prescottella equi]NKZ81077.1 hypothetical protein [Prescottella equi]